MKKFILFMAIAMCMMFVSSCSTSPLQKDVEGYLKTEVTDFKVVEVPTNEFFSYLPEFDALINASDSVEVGMININTKMNELNDSITPLMKILTPKKADEIKSEVDSLSKVLAEETTVHNDMVNEIDTLIDTHTHGTIFAVKCKVKNEEGKFNTDDEYFVFLYNTKGTLVQYEGLKQVAIITDAFAEVKELLEDTTEVVKDSAEVVTEVVEDGSAKE